MTPPAKDIASAATLAPALRALGRQCAEAGWLTQAEALFKQAWAMARKAGVPLDDTAAWETAVVLIQRGAYLEASEWLGRVAAPPDAADFWPECQDVLVRLCNAAGERASPNDGAPLAPNGLTVPIQPTVDDASAAPLVIRSLGRFEISRLGRPLPPCRSHKALTILRYLLVRPNWSAHKSELAELLWPDVAARESGHNLHVAVSVLRRYVDPAGAKQSLILFDRNSYLINPEAPLHYDCASFLLWSASGDRFRQADDQARAEDSFSRALECYRGDYDLADLEYEWASSERETLLNRYLVVLDRLGGIYVAQERFEPAIECFQRLLARDPYREDALRSLMLCYHRVGRRNDAIRQYDRMANQLVCELAIEPMPELQAVYRDLVGNGNGVEQAG